jgi:ribosomal protein S27E
MAGAALSAPPEAPTWAPEPHQVREYACVQCGHVLVMSGGGRHRVYFEPDDERRVDPVMDGRCPECGHGLPGKSSSSTTTQRSASARPVHEEDPR